MATRPPTTIQDPARRTAALSSTVGEEAGGMEVVDNVVEAASVDCEAAVELDLHTITCASVDFSTGSFYSPELSISSTSSY